MKRSNFTIYLLFAILSIIVSAHTYSQSFINFSRVTGGTGPDDVSDIQIINGETYLLGVTRSTSYPVTNGTIYRGETDLIISKYSTNGSIIFSTYLGGRGNDVATVMQIVDGEVYLTGYTDSINFPVTNGSTFGGLRDVFVTRLNTSGNIVFSRYLGSSRSETPTINGMRVIGNEVVIVGTTQSPGFPVTNNSIYRGGVSDAFVTKINANDGAIVSSTMIGGNREDFVTKAEFENNDIYVLTASRSTNMVITNGTPAIDSLDNGFVAKLNATDLSIVYSRYLAGSNRDYLSASKVVNGVLHIAGYTYSENFPVTNGSTSTGPALDFMDAFYTKLGSDGNILFSTYLITPDLDQVTLLTLSDAGDVYVSGRGNSPINGERKLILFKLNSTGNLVYTKNFNLGFGFPGSISMEEINGDLYVSGITQSAVYPVTNGSQFFSGGTGFLTRFDVFGNIVFSTYLGRLNSLLPMRIINGNIGLLGSSDANSYPVTDQSTVAGGTDNIIFIFKPDGTTFYSGYLGGNNTEIPQALRVNGNDLYLGGRSLSPDYPVTVPATHRGSGDHFFTKISFCPSGYFFDDDTLSPKIQTVCQGGLAEKITGVEIKIPSDSLPLLFLNGIATGQDSIKALYQWQSADNIIGPWNDVQNATFKDFTPVLSGSDRFFRRLAYSLPQCGSALIHTSDTATVLVNSLSAPLIDAGGVLNTCPGSPVTIGGSPTVTGGNPPYSSYLWDMGADSVSNPVVSPNASTIYTLVVTDSLGCRQIGQAVVLTNKADAGADKGACGGQPVRIGTPQIPGIQGISYNWQPAAFLSAANIAQPFANPNVTTEYSLTLTIPKSGGGTCETIDTVKVTPVAAPLTPDFAGPDKVFCLDDSVSIGRSPEPGFIYTWSPGSYLTSNTNSTAFYYPGNIIMPEPNPATLYLTAQKDGCSFSDETIIATIEARAGLDGCGPRLVGLPDRTPDIIETYSWTKISGPGNFTGATDLPQVPVSASVGAPTIYQLTVTYNGGSCTDLVTVPNFCSDCQTLIDVEALYRCASYEANGGNVRLIASSSLINAVYSWTPQVGLSSYTGNTVNLTDNVPRTYTVTAMDPNDTTRKCIFSIFVNDPAFSRPVFPAPDTVTCAGIPINIGLPPVQGYTYQWTGAGLSSNLISNPIANISMAAQFPVRVTDSSGCELRDTVYVDVQNVKVNGGPDYTVCSNGVVKLGTPAQPNTTYLWQPESSPWQNGTNQFSSQPEVFIATDVTFIVTATTTAGCITMDTVNVIVNNTPVIPNAADTFVCLGSTVRIGLPALPGVTYQWSPTTGLNNSTLAQPIVTTTTTRTYTVTATFPGTCAQPATDQVTVNVINPFFNLPDISFCPDNGAFELGNGAPPNMTSYAWLPQQLVTNSTIANPSTLNPPPANTTIFTLSIVDVNGCRFRDTVRIIPQITSPIAGADRLICKGAQINIGSISNVTAPAITYSWSPSTNLSSGSIPNPIFTATVGGVFQYILIKSDNIASCISRDTIVIRVIDSLLPSINSVSLCENSCLQIGPNPTFGIQYQWFPTTGLSNPNIANPILCAGSNSVVYTLTATNVNGCIATATVPVIVNPTPAAQISIPLVVACTGDPGITFNPQISPPGNYTYLWAPNNGTVSDIYALNPTISVTNTGVYPYTILVTDTATGCSNSATAILDVKSCTPLAIVGDFVWFDLDQNGIQESNEIGVSSMNVELYNSAGFNVASTITNSDGYYQFINVQPGTGYYILFSKPSGYEFTLQNVGGPTATNNSKADSSGRSNDFEVVAGSNIVNIDAGIIPGSILPVSLLSFNAVLRGEDVFIYWQTSSEYNNHYFEVERSTDGRTFAFIGRINGNGTTSLPHSYSMIDDDPFKGINYYRLKQVDLDGRFNYSSIVQVKINKAPIVRAFYDQSSNSVKIELNKNQEIVHARLFADNGQLISTAIIPANVIRHSLNVPALATGVYLLQLGNKKFSYTQKIFITR